MTWAAECQTNWPGLLQLSLVSALPLAVLLSWITLLLYRRAVGRAMRPSLADPKTSPEPPTPVPPPSTALALRELPAQPSAQTPLSAASGAAMWRLSGVYALAGLTHGAITTALMFLADGIGFLPVRFSAVWFVYAWPVVPVLALTVAGRRRAKRTIVAAYFALLIAFDLTIWAAGIVDGGAGQLILVWGIVMLAPTMLLWALGNRTMRCVGLVALSVSMVLTITWFASFQGLACLALTTRHTIFLDWWRPLQLLALLAAMALVWLTMRRWGSSVGRHRYSDLMVTIDSWWLVSTAIEMVLEASSIGVWTLLLPLAFAGYKLVTVVGLQWVVSREPSTRAPELLMLRVFGHARRTERLIDEIGLRWRYVGPINLVAGTDIATSFLDPDELLKFISARLGDAYIGDPQALDARLMVAAGARQADGRYGVHEFFCRDRMWRQTVERLARQSDAVVIDLRSFGAQNRGCEFELGVLLADVDLAKVTMIADATTDDAHLERTLQAMWARVGGGGVNGSSPRPALAMVRVGSHDVALAGNLLDHLFATAT